jgi:signal transduction histidine kinase
LDAGQRGRIERVRLGSEVEVTGIAIMQSRSVWDGTVRSSGINLLLQDAAAVRVVRGPPWWTPTVLLRIVAVLVALVVLGTVWVYLLRRRVEQQTAIIRRNFEREAIWEERSRIARDIHDDVGAALTQISLLGELGRREGASAADMHGQLARVTAKSREAVRALDEIVWTVNPRNDSVARAASYICQAVQDLLRDSGIRCRLQVPDDLPDAGLAARVRHNLFLAVKEAVNNVIKHAGATELRLALTAGAGEFGVRIEDNGCGFDPAGVPPERNGLGNMRRRLADVGGRCEITAGIGRGTVVAFIVPITGATSNEGWQETRK